MSAAIVKTARAYQSFRISPDDSNRLAIVFDPIGERVPFITCVEIFDEHGKTPPNVHRVAFETFFVLKGRALATCNGESVELETGSSLLIPPGGTHVIENIGAGRLYMLTTMVPNEEFAELIRKGVPVPLDEEDLAVLGTAR